MMTINNELPIEINEMIAEHCDIKTLMKFQYVSKNAFYGVENYLMRINKGFIKNVSNVYDNYLNKMKFDILRNLVSDNVPVMKIAELSDKNLKNDNWIRLLKQYMPLYESSQCKTMNYLVKRELLRYLDGNFNFLNSYIICRILQIERTSNNIDFLINTGSDNLHFLEIFGMNFKEIQKTLSYNIIRKDIVKKKDIPIISKYYVTGNMLEYIIYNNELYNFSNAKLYGRIGYNQLKNYTDICVKKQNFITKFIYESIKTFLLSKNIKMYKMIQKYEIQVVNKRLKLISLNGNYCISTKSREYNQYKEKYTMQYEKEKKNIYNKLFL